MGKSKEPYFERFLNFLEQSNKDTLTMTLDEIRAKLGKDKSGEDILCNTPENHQVFWSFDKQHRFPYYLGKNGWFCSSCYSNGKKEVTFYKKGKKEKNMANSEIIKKIDINSIIKNAKSFDESFEYSDDKNSTNYHVIKGHERGKSWKYCYDAFSNGFKSKEPDIDYLCLHLAFYLASWGMYRGSTFLFRNDYKVHEKVVKEILKHPNLRGQIPCSENILELKELIEFIKSSYGPHNHPSETLITKIILGTLGCTPAYDTYVVKSMKKYISVTTLNQDSLLALGEIYKTYETEFNKANTEYPPMKFLDMAFFRESYDKSAVDGDADNENADEE